MGGKASRGTPADRRLKENKPMPGGMPRQPMKQQTKQPRRPRRG